MSKNDISMSYRIRRRPRGVSVLDAIRAMRDALDGDGELPDGYDVTWGWRNTPGQDLREDDFGSAVTASRSSFVTLMRRRLDRDIAKHELMEPPRRPPTRDRSEAARRGWETRRRRAAERESLRRQRSIRAQVAWAKRKRKRRKGRKR